MAAALVRRVSGLLGPLGARTLAHLSRPLRPPGILPRLLPPAAVRAPRPAALHQPPRWNLLDRVSALGPLVTQQSFRNLTYFSLRSGKRKTVKSVTDRFMRLHCGLWIRRKAGYKKKLWKKKPARRKRLREHVFCNKTQSKLLNKMTTSFWKRRNWFLDDPYLKYHNRVNLKV